MITTWILVFYLTGSGKSIGIIPGYPTYEKCEQAAAALYVADNQQRGGGVRANFDFAKCIPGPSRP